jgi:hypothetical protein
MPQARITVFTVSFSHAGRCASVIQDLSRQSIAHDIELIVVATSRDGLTSEALAPFRSHQWILLRVVESIGVAMAAAVHAARAPYVTYAEEHATFDSRWAEALVAAHDRGYAAVGFTMRNANPQTLTSWAHLYGQFGPSVDPVETSEVRLLAGHHASYRRARLLEYGELLPRMLEDEGALFLDLGAHGEALLMEGAAISYHINLSRLTAYMHLDFVGQRGFAAARALAGEWPAWKRLFYAAACPLVPAVRLKRILFHLRRTGRYRELMPRILLPILPALAVGAVGEALGYLSGAGTSAAQKLGPELRRREFLSRRDPARS